MKTSELPEGACDMVSERGASVLPLDVAIDGAFVLAVDKANGGVDEGVDGVDNEVVELRLGSTTRAVVVVVVTCGWPLVAACCWPGSDMARLTATFVPRFSSSMSVASLVVANVVPFSFVMMAAPLAVVVKIVFLGWFCSVVVVIVAGVVVIICWPPANDWDTMAIVLPLISDARLTVKGGAGTTKPLDSRFCE